MRALRGGAAVDGVDGSVDERCLVGKQPRDERRHLVRFARLMPFLIEPVRREVHDRVMAEQLSECRIVASALGMHAGAIGAAQVVVRDLVADPTAVAMLQPLSDLAGTP